MADEKKDTEEISDDLNFKNKDELISFLKSLKKDQDEIRELISDKNHESDDQKDEDDDLDDLDKFFDFRD